jgi:hypothetical protein
MNPLLFPHFVVCMLLALISIPLILKRIPPNRLYGVRTEKTLNDPDTWYNVNWFGGWAILTSALTSTISLALVPQFLPGWLDHAGLLVLAPLVVALAAIWLYSMRISEEDGE